jgi:flagellar biosynthetic protein FliR
MTFHVSTMWVVAVLLIATRVGAATALSSVFGPIEVPAQVRVILALALAVFLVGTEAGTAPAISSTALVSGWGLALAAASELFIGATFAFGFMAAYAATQVSGRALDIQIGFGAANVLNPTTRTLAPLLGSLFGVVAVVGFLALDGHHVLIRALALSVTTIPPGTLAYAPNWSLIAAHSTVMFTLGLSFAAPVMFALLLSDIAMGVFSRSMPQLNVFVLSFAVKIVLGLLGLAASIRLASGLLEKLWGTTFQFWSAIAAGRG